MQKRITFILICILFVLILSPTSLAATYSIEIEPILDKEELNLDIFIRDINNLDPGSIVITHPPYIFSQDKKFGKLEDIRTPEIIITPGTSSGKTLMFADEGFEPETIEFIPYSSNERSWHELTINLTKILNKTYDSYAVRINNLHLAGVFKYEYDKFPKDWGNIILFLKLPPSSDIELGFSVEKGYKITNDSKFVIVDMPNINSIFQEQNIDFKEGYTRQDASTGEVFRIDEEKSYYFKTDKEGYIGIYLRFERPDRYGKFLDISILLIYFFAITALILRDFRLIFPIFMFLLAIYSLFANMFPKPVPTLLLDTQIIKPLTNFWFILLLLLIPLAYLFFGTHSKKMYTIISEIKTQLKSEQSNRKLGFWIDVITCVSLFITVLIFLILFITKIL